MKKTTIASTLVAIGLAFGSVAACAQATNPNASPDVKSMPPKDNKAKDTMPGGTGAAAVNPNASPDVKSMPPKDSKAKDTSMGASSTANTPAPINPNASQDVQGKPVDSTMRTSKTSKSSKSSKSSYPACSSMTASGTLCRQP